MKNKRDVGVIIPPSCSRRDCPASVGHATLCISLHFAFAQNKRLKTIFAVLLPLEVFFCLFVLLCESRLVDCCLDDRREKVLEEENII